MNETLEHHGILGMKWGVRRYQNKDGTWTEEGKEHRAEEKPLFTKEELDGVKSRNMDNDGDWAINDAMFIEVADHYFPNGIKTDSRWAQEFYKFCDNPHKYMESVKKQKEYWSIPTPERAKTPLADSLADTDEYKEYVNSYKKLNDQFQRDGKNSKDVEDHYADALDKATNKALELSREYFGMHDIGYGPAGELVWDRLRLDTENETKHSDDSTEDSLMHHGILGMKWGIRRYQNADGSLTAAGRKRYGVDENDGQRSSSGPSSGDSSNSITRTPAKSASEMTDQELNQALNRLRMEQQYNELTGAKSSNQYQNQQNFSTPPSNTGNLSNAELQAYITRLDMEKRYAQLTAPPPKEVSAGKKFMNDVVGPAINQVAKAFIVASLSKALGLKGDGDNGGNNNNNNGGKKNNNDDSQYKSLKKELNDLKSMMGSQKKNQDNGGNQKKESSRDRDNDSESSSLPEPQRNTHRDSIFSAARDAARQAREQQREQKRQERAQKREDDRVYRDTFAEVRRNMRDYQRQEREERQRQSLIDDSRRARESQNRWASVSAFLSGLERQNGIQYTPKAQDYRTSGEKYLDNYIARMGR